MDPVVKVEGFEHEEHHAQQHRDKGEKEALFAEEQDAQGQQQAAAHRQENEHQGVYPVRPESPAADDAEDGREDQQDHGALCEKAGLVDAEAYLSVVVCVHA